MICEVNFKLDLRLRDIKNMNIRADRVGTQPYWTYEFSLISTVLISQQKIGHESQAEIM